MSPNNKKKLNILRKKLDILDDSFISLIKKRTEIVKKVLKLKKHKNKCQINPKLNMLVMGRELSYLYIN